MCPYVFVLCMHVWVLAWGSWLSLAASNKQGLYCMCTDLQLPTKYKETALVISAVDGYR